MKKIILVIMILFVQVSFAQKYIIKDKVDTLSLKVPSTLPTEVGQVPMYFTGGMSFEKVYTQSQVDDKDQDILTSLNRDYTTRTEYEELRLLIEALQDSITALRSSIGFITPTFPDAINYFNASQDGSNIKFKWTKYDLSVVADSFEVVWSLQDPTAGGDPPSYTDFTTDTFYVITSPPTNTVYWGWVKAWKNNTSSNASPVDSAFVYEAPTVNNWKYVSLAGGGDKSGVDSANAFAINAITGIVAGDTLVFLGGTYTTGLTINFSGTAALPITLKSSYKNGAVFQGLTSVFSINDSYLKFEGFKFTRCGVAFDLRSGSNGIYIDSNYVTKATGQGALVYMSGTTGNVSSIDSIFIRYNIAVTDSQTTNQTDIIYGQRGIGKIFILTNQLDQENTTGTQHNDNIQIYNAANDIGDIIVANNKIRNLKTSDSQGMMGNTSASGYKTILYNNVVYMTGTSHGLWSYVPDASQGDVYAIHNTLYTNSVSGKAPLFVQGDNITVKNNVISSAGLFAIYFDTLYTNTFDCNYNLYHSSDTRYVIGMGYVMTIYGKTLAYWQAYWLGQDANSLNANPLFTSTSNSYTGLTLQAGSPAKNAGTNLQALIESWGLEWKTIEGTVRDATPDMGAY